MPPPGSRPGLRHEHNATVGARRRSDRSVPAPRLAAQRGTVRAGAKMDVRKQRQVSTKAVTTAGYYCSTPIWVTPACWPLRARGVTRSTRISWPHSAPSRDLSPACEMAAAAAQQRRGLGRPCVGEMGGWDRCAAGAPKARPTTAAVTGGPFGSLREPDMTRDAAVRGRGGSRV